MGLAGVAPGWRSSVEAQAPATPPPLLTRCQGGRCLPLTGQRTAPKLPRELAGGQGDYPGHGLQRIHLYFLHHNMCCQEPYPHGSSNSVFQAPCLFPNRGAVGGGAGNGGTKAEEALVRATRMINEENQDADWSLKRSLFLCFFLPVKGAPGDQTSHPGRPPASLPLFPFLPSNGKQLCWGERGWGWMGCAVSGHCVS